MADPRKEQVAYKKWQRDQKMKKKKEEDKKKEQMAKSVITKPKTTLQKLTATGFSPGALASPKVKQAAKKAAEPARQKAIQDAEKALANAKDRRSRAAASQKLRDAQLPLYGRDAKLGTAGRDKIQDAKELWHEADRLEKTIGRTSETQAMKRYAHNQAERVRIQHGYTGGTTGEDQESPLLNAEERQLTKVGQENLKQLKLWHDYGKRNKDGEMMLEAERQADILRAGYTPYSDQAKVSWADLHLPDKDVLQDDIDKAWQDVKDAQMALRNYINTRQGMATFGTNDPTLQRLQENLAKREEAMKTAEKRLEQAEYLEKYGKMEFQETGHKWSDFWSQFKANKALGRITQDASEAYNEYLKDPTSTNLAMAMALSQLEGDFSQRNAKVLDDKDQVLPWLSQSAAGYLPQLWDQTKASVAGAAAGAAAGAGVGFAAGGIGAVPGALWGARAGAVAGSGKYSYDTMRGAAFRQLVEAGVDYETAREAAGDEAVISALIEMADTGVDIFTLGIGSALKAAGKGAAKAATKTAGKKLATALGKYGLNIGSEMAQEASQQAVSYANLHRDDTGLWDLAKETWGVGVDAVTGKNQEARDQMWEAAQEGGKIAALMGGAGMVTSAAVNKGLEKAITTMDRTASDKELGKRVKEQGREAVQELIEEGYASEETAYLAAPVATKLQKGETPSDQEVGRLARALRSEEEPVQADPVQESEDILEEAARETVQEAQEEVQAATFAAPKEVVAEEQSVAPAAAESVLEGEEDILVQAAREMTAPKTQEVSKVVKSLGYGQHGTQTFERIVENSDMTVEEAKMRFQSAYEAGLTNTPRERVSLLGGIQEQAYNAGRQDYILTLNRAQDGSQYATIRGKDSGLILTDAAKGVEPALVNDLHKVSKTLGIKTMFVEHIENGSEDVVTGGYMTDDGVLVIARDAVNPYIEVAKHEITHRLQKLAPKEYTAFRNLAVEYESRDRGYGNTTLVEEMQDFYAENGVHLTTEGAMDEIAANFAERLFTDEKARKAMAEQAAGDKQTRTTMEKFWQAVREFLKKVKRVFKGDQAKMDQVAQEQYGATIAELEEAERLWKEAYRAAAENVKKGQEQAVIGGAASIKDQALEFSDLLTQFSLREKNPPKKVGVAYKVFFAKNGELYPPMVANPGGAGTPVGVWLDADVGAAAPPSKTGRAQVKAGGKGTQGGSGSLAFRPGWHLGDLPMATQFNRKNPETGKKDLFPADFVWAECEYAMDVDYQEEAMSYGYTEKGKFRHAYAGLPRLPEDGYYRYRTNPNPDTVPWVITGAMKVKRILTDAETDAILRKAGIEPLKRQGGPIDLEKLGIKAGETSGKQFSMKSPVEQKRDLIALHNLDESKLMKSLDLGGFPMPSIAVTATDIPHTNFGDITLVMNKSTVDPKASKKNVVYSADAWTPTFPRIEYEVNRDAEIALYDKARKAGGKLPDMYANRVSAMASSIEDYLNNEGSEEGVIARFKDEYAIKALYLADKGETVETKTQEIRHEKKTSEMLDAMLKLFDEDIDVLRKMPLNQLHAKYAEGMKQVLLDHGRTEQQAEMAVAKKGGAIGGFDKYISRIIRYAQEPAYRTETVTDTKAMEQDIDSRVDKKGFEKWLADMFRDLIKDSGVRNEKDTFTPSGKRRTFQQTHYPVTLDNIAKAMAKQNGGDTVNAGGGFYGVKTLRAGTAKRFKSIADMHKLEGRLKNLTQEEAEAVSDALGQRLSDVTQRIYEKMPHKSGNQFIDYDTIGHTMMEVAAGGKYTVDAIQSVFSGYNLGNQLAGDVRDLLFDVSEMPVHIFEAKPERAVRFDEVLAAVVPDTASTKLRERLDEAGVNVLEYKRDDDADRLAKVNSVEGAKFSLKAKDKDYLAAVERGDMDAAQKMVDEAAKAAGYTVKGYHGTAEHFYVFDSERAHRLDDLGPGHYFTTNEEEGKYYTDPENPDVTLKIEDAAEQAAYDAGYDYDDDYDAYIDAYNDAYDEEVLRYQKDARVLQTYLKVNNPFVVSDDVTISVDEARDIVSRGPKDWARDWNYEITRYANDGRIKTSDVANNNFSTYLSGALMKLGGYDGIIDETVHDKFRSPEGARHVIVFRSNQIKSADPVTYDDSGNVIPLSERFSEGNPDIRFSLKAQKDLMKENAKLREVNQGLRQQFKTTKFAKVDKKALDRFTKDLLKDYASGADINEIRQMLDEVYTYIANGETEGTSWTEAQRRAYEAAVAILESAVTLDNQMWEQYGDLRRYLRTTAITLNKAYDHDLVGYENLEEFRRANFGRLKITKDGTPVDVIYRELAVRWPEFFDEYTTMNQADQLLAIADVLDQLQPTEINPYSHNMREAATWLASDILERFFELPQAKPTFADKAEQKLTRQVIKDHKKLERLREQKNEKISKIIQENREKVKTVQTKEKVKREEAVQKVKEHYKAKESKGSETRKARELRAKIMRHAKDLNDKLLKPTDKHHVPEDLRKPVAAMLDAINQESQFVIDEATGKRKKGGEGLPTKRTQAFEDMRKQYQAILDDNAPDEGLIVDPAITAMLERVTAMRDTPLHAMTSQELDDLWQALRVVEHMVNNAGKTLAFAKYERTSEWAQAFVDDTDTRKSWRRRKGKRIGLDLENPYTFFSHFGDAGKDLFRMLRNAQDQQQMMVTELEGKVKEIVSGKQVKAWQKETREFTTDRGDKLTLTTAQVMEIYELTKREQARDHLVKGGIVQPQVESKKITRGTDAVLLTETDLGNIVAVLTDEQVQVADGLQKLTTTLLAEWGNEASMKAYGYKKFLGKDYWPIKSAREGIHSKIETGGNNTRSIKNIGLAKNVMPHASNPLDIGGIFKTFAGHAGDMTDYAAWLCPMEDAQRIYNFKFRDEMGQQTGKTIKGLLDTIAGTGGQDYWFNLMEDIQNGLAAKSDTGIGPVINKAIGSARRAAVGANLRVIIQQPTAILRAAAILNPADMVGGLAVGGGWKKALEHSAIAQRKDMGGFDISSPAQLSEILFDDKKGLQRFNEAMMWGAGKADAVTWGRIWNACEIATKRQHKDLEKGSDAFYKEVSRLFSEVVDQSQVVDGVLQRSQIMRSSGDMMKAATAFMGEPIMSLNMFTRAYDNLVKETDGKKRSAAIKTFGRTAMALLVTNAVNAVAQSIVDAWRDDDPEKDYLERMKGQLIGLDGTEESKWDKVKGATMEGNLGSSLNPVLYIPFAKDLISLMEGYDVERADAAVAADIIQSATTLVKSLGGDGKRTIAYAVQDLAKQVGKVFGVSAPNVMRDVWGIVRSVAIETDNFELQYKMEKAIYKMGNSSNVSRFTDLLYRAYKDDKDAFDKLYKDMLEEDAFKTVNDDGEETSTAEVIGKKLKKRLMNDLFYLYEHDEGMYKAMYKDLTKRGLLDTGKEGTEDFKSTEDAIASAMETLMKKVEGVDSVNDLDKRFVPPEKQDEYDDMLGSVRGSSLWKDATEDQKDKVEGDVYDIVMETKSGVKVTEKLEGGDEYGVDETDYLLYRLALSMVDQPTESGNMGSYNNSERADAIAKTSLSDKEKAYLWSIDTGSDEVLDALEAGVDIDTYAEFKAFYSTAKSDKDENGKTVRNSKKKKITKWLGENNVKGKTYSFLYHEVAGYKK